MAKTVKIGRSVRISRSGEVTVIGPWYCYFDGRPCSFDYPICKTAVKIVCERQKRICEGNIPRDIKLGKVMVTEGSITYACPKCGAPQMGKWVQTTVHDKKRKTEATVHECHKCRTFFVITTKVVNIREVKNVTSDSIWTEIKPKDLQY